jgi:hypothetical protein
MEIPNLDTLLWKTLEQFGVFGALVFALLYVLKNPDSIKSVVENLKEAKDLFRKPVQGVDMTIRQISNCVHASMEALLYKYDADRCYVFEYARYHANIKPLPWQECSCTYEICNKTRNVPCEKDTLQELPLDAIPYWRDRLGKDGQISLHDVDTLKEEDLESWKILTRQQISSVYCVSISNFRGLPLGFVGLDYCNGRKSVLKSQKDMHIFLIEAVKIGGLLTMKRNGTLEQLAGTL